MGSNARLLIVVAVAIGFAGCLSAADRESYRRTKELEQAAAGCLAQGKTWRMAGEKLECVD
jgi:hypothetical protein